MTNLEEYYNKFNEEKRLDSRHGQVEFQITMHYVHQMLSNCRKQNNVTESQIKILDIGAGTGRYSIPLAEEGYDVTAVELVKHNLGRLKAKSEKVKAFQGNAMKLKRLADDSFDVTLLFGPMYHLIAEEDKCKALLEAKRVTKPNGIIMVAYVMNEYSVVTYAFKEKHILECIEQNRFTEDYRTVASTDELYDYVRVEDIDRYNTICKLERVKILSPDGPANYIRPFLNQLSEEEFSYFIKYQLSICERSDLLGAGAHIVDILRVV